MNNLRIVFAGTPDIGLPCLQALANSAHELIAVYTQPDRPAGRGQKLQYSPVKHWALNRSIPVYQPINFKSAESLDSLQALKPDLMVVMAYGLILPKSVLDIPKLGCINIHTSLLPRWRGASPIQQAILAGDEQTGVTIMQMDVGMDTGDCLVQKTCPIYPSDTAESLYQRLSLLAPEPLLAAIDAKAQHQANARPQNTSGISYAPKIKKTDALIHWDQPLNQIDQLIRGYYPWPIAYTYCNGLLIRLHQAHPLDEKSNSAAGTIVELSPRGMLVNTQDGILCVTTLQLPGGKPLALKDYLNAHRHDLKVGLVLG